MMMKRFVVTFIALLSSICMFATEATDVSMMELNGPVKSYCKDREIFYFNKSGFLTTAYRFMNMEFKYSRWLYYEHEFDKNGRRVKTLVYKDSTRKKLSETIVYKYSKEGLLSEAKYKSAGNYNTYNTTPYWKTVLAEYGSKSHTPNSILKKKRYKIRGRKFRRKILTDSIYCYYNEKGDLYLFKNIDRYSIREVTFAGDTLDKIKILRTKGEGVFIYNAQGKILDVRLIEDAKDSSSGVCYEYYKYNNLGLLEEKREFRKDYMPYNSWEIHDVDCVTTYMYDQWNNLIRAEHYFNKTKETELTNYPIEYYE